MKNQAMRFKPARKCGRIWYRISEPKTKVSKDAKIMALLAEIMKLLK